MLCVEGVGNADSERAALHCSYLHQYKDLCSFVFPLPLRTMVCYFGQPMSRLSGKLIGDRLKLFMDWISR